MYDVQNLVPTIEGLQGLQLWGQALDKEVLRVWGLRFADRGSYV